MGPKTANIKDEQAVLNFDSRGYLKDISQRKMMGVFGSRSIGDERVETIILEKIKEWNITHISTCQEPQGVSETAQKVCKDYGYPLQVHFLNMQYLRGAFEQRSKEMIAESDCFLVIHDGESKGTANELKLVKKCGKLYHYIVVEPSEYDRSVGFNIKDDWDIGNEWDI